MNCSLCGKPALRVGSKGRGYCGAHELNAWQQIKRESIHKSAEAEAHSERVRMEYNQDRLERAI